MQQDLALLHLPQFHRKKQHPFSGRYPNTTGSSSGRVCGTMVSGDSFGAIGAPSGGIRMGNGRRRWWQSVFVTSRRRSRTSRVWNSLFFFFPLRSLYSTLRKTSAQPGPRQDQSKEKPSHNTLWLLQKNLTTFIRTLIHGRSRWIRFAISSSNTTSKHPRES